MQNTGYFKQILPSFKFVFLKGVLIKFAGKNVNGKKVIGVLIKPIFLLQQEYFNRLLFINFYS